MKKHAELLIGGLLAGHIKKADLDPMLLWGLMGAGAGAGTSALRSTLGQDGGTFGEAAGRALRTGLIGGALGATAAGGLKLMGVDPNLPNVVQLNKDKSAPASSSVGVGLLSAGALGGASALDRARAANLGFSANADTIRGRTGQAIAKHLGIKNPDADMVKILKQLGTKLPKNAPAAGLWDRLRGYNVTGSQLERNLQAAMGQAGRAGQAGRLQRLQVAAKALRQGGSQAASTGLGRLGVRGALVGGGLTGLAHYILNRRES